MKDLTMSSEVPAPAQTDQAPRSWLLPLWIVASIGLIVFLRLARDALIPFVLSLLFALVLSGGVEFLRSRRIPRVFSALLLLILFAAALGGLLKLVWAPAQEW